MPVLGYETHKKRKALSRAFDDALKQNTRRPGWTTSSSNPSAAPSALHDGSGPAMQLIRGYAMAPSPLHYGRTLDRFAYSMLDSTETRDRDQVSYRWGKRLRPDLPARDRPIIMVDQLWLWLLEDGITTLLMLELQRRWLTSLELINAGSIITSFPGPREPAPEGNLGLAVLRSLCEDKTRPLITSAEDLVHMILRAAVDFFKRKGPMGFQLEEGFRTSINHIVSLSITSYYYLDRRREKGNRRNCY